MTTAEALQSGDFTYTLHSGNTNTVVISKYTGSGDVVAIPSTLDGKTVVSIGDAAFSACSNLTSVALSPSITSVGFSAFSMCNSLTNVTFSDSITRIGKEAFYSCRKLVGIAIPSSVTNIGDGAFSWCASLTAISLDQEHAVFSSLDGILFDKSQTSIIQFPGGKVGSYTIPSSVTNIANYAFGGCYKLTGIIIPDGVTNIGNSAFSMCFGLTGIAIPDSVVSIGDSVFANCSGLTSMTIPDKVTGIGTSAFWYCVKLTNVTISANVSTIKTGAFTGCAKLGGVYFKGDAPIAITNAFGNSTNATVYYLAGTTGWPVVPNAWCGRPTALWQLVSTLTVNGGVGSGSYTNGQSVTITANEPPLGQRFDRWTGDTSNVANVFVSPTTLVMPVADTAVTATYAPLVTVYDLAVSNGSGDGSYTNGQIVAITADAPAAGMMFDRWTGAVPFVANVISPSTTVTMPDTNIAVSATYATKTSDFGYSSNGSAITITDYTGTGGTIVIPSTINGLPVTSIGASAFFGCSSLTNVTVPAGVTSMGANAFGECSALKVISVDAANPAFSTADGVLFNKSQSVLIRCPGGKAGSYDVPAGVTSIGADAFDGCSRLTNLTLPAGVTSIGSYAFSGCTLLKGITIPASVTSIGAFAFYYCLDLLSITVDAANANYISVDGILFNKGQTALVVCPSGQVGSVAIPAGVVSIEARAFSYCSDLTGVSIPGSVTNIGTLALFGCRKMTAIDVEVSNPAYCSVDGILFNKGQTTLLVCPAGKAGSVVIPLGVTSIGYNAFASCSGLTNITISAGVTNIEVNAFYYCTGLKSVTIPAGVTRINNYIFYGCSGLSSVSIPAGVSSIGYCAFAYCSSLATVGIPAKVTSFSDLAFYRCPSLTGVYFKGNAPVSVVTAFDGSTNATVYYLAGTTGWPVVPNAWCGRPTALWYLVSSLTVTDGIGSGSYTNGQEVLITANAPPEGQRFSRWTGGTNGVADVFASTTTLVMPAANVAVTATFVMDQIPCTTVSNVVAAQVPGTKQVLITYDVASDVTNIVTVSLVVSNAAGIVNASHFSGHVGPGVPIGNGRQIVWDGGADQDGQNLTGLQVWVDASIIYDYLVVDLSGGTAATNYPVTYLATVPTGGWTDVYKTTKLVLRRIPAGTFTMGSPTNELGRQSSETQHQVTLTKAFYIGVFEVTQRQWELVMGDRPSYFNNATYYQTRPVEQVSYYDIRENPNNSAISPNWPASDQVHADSFMGKLRAKTGLSSFDLPTESQWEYACRAGTTTALNSGYNLTSTGNDPRMSEVGRYYYNHTGGYSSGSSVSTAGGTAAAGSYLSNAWGLYDMHGNVFEWCLDWYWIYPGTVTDPAGAASGSYRVNRGGNWCNVAHYGRSAFRNSSYYPDFRNGNYGFRVARILP